MRKGVKVSTWRVRHGGPVRAAFRRSAAVAVPAGPAAPTVVWVYAVTTDLEADQVCGLTGVAGEPVRVVAEAGLGAVVGSVSDALFGEEWLTNLLTDLTTVEMVGRAHHKVVASAASAGPVVPLRLATTYPDDATIRRRLAARCGELTGMLRAFAGRQEWGVKVYVEPRSAAEVTAEAGAEKIGQALSAIAVATRYPSPDPRPGGHAAGLVLNGAYLLSAEQGIAFTKTVQALVTGHDAFRAEVTGPWPPYSFADR